MAGAPLRVTQCPRFVFKLILSCSILLDPPSLIQMLRSDIAPIIPKCFVYLDYTIMGKSPTHPQ